MLFKCNTAFDNDSHLRSVTLCSDYAVQDNLLLGLRAQMGGAFVWLSHVWRSEEMIDSIRKATADRRDERRRRLRVRLRNHTRAHLVGIYSLLAGWKRHVVFTANMQLREAESSWIIIRLLVSPCGVTEEAATTAWPPSKGFSLSPGNRTAHAALQ